jgi:hypothetical protein
LAIQLRDTYYLYCGVSEDMVIELISAPSIGSYYNQEIKGRFGCSD